MSDKITILKSAYRKLDQLPLSFDMPPLDDSLTDEMVEKLIGGDLNDVLREVHMLSTSDISEMSEDEMRIENRIVYHILRRFRNSTSVYFKYSTGSDGKTVDKTQVTKTMNTLIDEYDNEFKVWRKNGVVSSSAVWSRSSTVNMGKDSTQRLTDPKSN
jgi:hypothetical protein